MYSSTFLPEFTRRLLVAAVLCWGVSARANPWQMPEAVQEFVEQNCLDCHGYGSSEGGLDFDELGFDLSRRDVFQRWTLIHDRVQRGEMPPPDDGIVRAVTPAGWSSRKIAQQRAEAAASAGADSTDSSSCDNAEAAALSDVERVLFELAQALDQADRQRLAATGRAKVRRLNRLEYENTLRQALDAPWLQVADRLPEDGVDHLFNKIGERLDVSHVQMARFLATAEYAVRMAVGAAAHESQTRKFYAREEASMRGYLHYRFGQTAATRSIVPLDGTTPELEIIRKKQPLTVGEADPEKRERESMGVFSGVYSATTKYDFTRIDAPTDGYYRLRFKTYTFLAGPNGADGGDDHGLTGGNRAWWRPDRNVAFPGQRSEPITLYALSPGGDSRWLTVFDSYPEPTIFECVVPLRQGEGIRPDAARLVRTRPGWSGNPNATPEGVPGFAMNWLEVTGPLHALWPPASYQAVFGDLPFAVEDGAVQVAAGDPRSDARRLLDAFYQRALGGREPAADGVEPFVALFDLALSAGYDFTDAMITATAAVLCSPEFLYLDAAPGPLATAALRQRLAYFLWNGPPDTSVPDPCEADASVEWLSGAVDRMLDDPRSDRFIDAFLDYWLDLRDLHADAPDAELYPDYYLDEMLTESSLRETRAFFRELIAKDLPARNLVASDFAFVDERLATHYGLPADEGVQLRRVDLPPDSPLGGLLTQASVLKVTANGTTTSPVLRGVWIAERILGLDIPPPPSGVPAVEPDIRGATTIREQLEKHRQIESCGACHRKFDPVGFALESFDVAGGWRERYRALGGAGEPVSGIGKNGHAFRFSLAQPVESSGVLQDGRSFRDVRELKSLLAADERALARNLLQRLVTYATGAPVSFADRAEVEQLLDRAADSQYGVRTLIHAVVQSEMFRHK